MIPIQLAAVLVAPLLFQDGERRPVTAEPQPSAIEAARDVEPQELSVYEVGHLLGLERLDHLKDLLRSSAGRIAGARELELLQELAQQRERADGSIESVSRAIRDMMQPAFDEQHGRIERLERDSLVIVGTPAQHTWLQGFLQHASTFEGLVDVQTRIIRLDRGQLARLQQVRSGEVLGEEQVEALLERLADERDELVAPRVLVHPFQRAELTAVERTAYIADYELKIIPGQDVEIADPVIETAESGVRLELRCVPLASGELSMDVSVVCSSLAQPIPVIETTIGARGHKVALQVPEVTSIRLEGRFEVLPGETLIMASTDADGGQEVLVLVRAALVEALPDER